ncbi:MAG: ATP-dependent DNA ligase [Actinobacteria bacterium]|nr:non-homologous end-joining DNA ligase [Actinomycetota bacterium]MCB9412710.1 ATP-dependent DNA ligase [Actinomycetota bacterium]
MTTSSPLTIELGGRSVRVSSPDRVVFPAAGATKGDVAEYYETVATRLLTAVGRRPTTLERWPKGVHPGMTLGEDGFYSKRVPRGAPDWVGTAEITFPSGRTAVEVCPSPDEPATVVWAAQMGTITFHPWPVRTPEVDLPDQLRLDFDPAPGCDFADASRTALAARDLLTELGWQSYVKTSGGRGVHVFVPIAARWSFVQVRHAVIAIARELERRDPSGVTTSWWKEERGERVFIDFNQAARDRTMASAYSLRARPLATVSMPVSWDDLPHVRPDDFTLRTVPELLGAPDPWLGMLDQAFDLSPALQMWERDLASGLGDLPYPPDYPKMPGEPRRVAPSRRKRDD